MNTSNAQFLDKWSFRLTPKMTEKQKEQFKTKWTKTRAKGKSHFVLFFGVLGAGLTMAVLQLITMEALETILHGTSFPGRMIELFTTGWGFIKIAIYVPLFCLSGYVWGRWMWRHYENVYRSLNK